MEKFSLRKKNELTELNNISNHAGLRSRKNFFDSDSPYSKLGDSGSDSHLHKLPTTTDESDTTEIFC